MPCLMERKHQAENDFSYFIQLVYYGIFVSLVISLLV